ncbi:MAG: SDR family NAD(P)-dependent oxidoreductase [Chloroflexi bacterium]|nr:SDR family NAD(P)-dependent oxidoreductase [Chloroflexota bacterium]
MSDSSKTFDQTPPSGTSQGRPASATPLQPRQRAILVGSSGGIGAALARKLANEGYTLALLDRNAELSQAISNEINQTHNETRALSYQHNVTDYDSVPDLLRRIVADLGGLDLFVYVAGVIHFPGINEYNFEEDRKMVEVNLLGGMAWLSQVAPLFQNMKSGQIVGVSSVAGDRGRVGNPGYNTSKAGFTTYLEALRNRLTRHGVNVITIKPGMVKTEMLNLPGAPRPVLAVTAEQAAEGIWNAIRKRRQAAYISGIWRWVMLVIRHIPSFIFRRMSF